MNSQALCSAAIKKIFLIDVVWACTQIFSYIDFKENRPLTQIPRKKPSYGQVWFWLRLNGENLNTQLKLMIPGGQDFSKWHKRSDISFNIRKSGALHLCLFLVCKGESKKGGKINIISQYCEVR